MWKLQGKGASLEFLQRRPQSLQVCLRAPPGWQRRHLEMEKGRRGPATCLPGAATCRAGAQKSRKRKTRRATEKHILSFHLVLVLACRQSHGVFRLSLLVLSRLLQTKDLKHYLNWGKMGTWPALAAKKPILAPRSVTFREPTAVPSCATTQSLVKKMHAHVTDKLNLSQDALSLTGTLPLPALAGQPMLPSLSTDLPSSHLGQRLSK